MSVEVVNRFLMEAQTEQIVDEDGKGDEIGRDWLKHNKTGPDSWSNQLQILIIYLGYIRVKADSFF